MSEQVKCDCCGNNLTVNWSDTHGVGCCINCGLPYRIYHYEAGDDGKDHRVDKPPAVMLKESGVNLARRYWAETKSRVFPACFDMGFLSGRDRSYSGATREECERFNAWMRKNDPIAAAEERA